MDFSLNSCYDQGEVQMITRLKMSDKKYIEENSTYINDSWEKPLLSLTQS